AGEADRGGHRGSPDPQAARPAFESKSQYDPARGPSARCGRGAGAGRRGQIGRDRAGTICRPVPGLRRMVVALAFSTGPVSIAQPPPRIRKPPMSLLAQPFDAVIFDMDGTLLDTEAVFKAIVYEVCTELGFAMTDHVHGRMVGSSHEATAALLAEAFGATFPY